METIVLRGVSKSNMKLLLEIAHKLGVTGRKLSNSEMEDVGLINAIKEEESGEYVDANKYLKKLRSK